MADSLRITYDVELANFDVSTSEVEAFVEFTLRGSVTIHSNNGSMRIGPCGLLGVSRSLIRLCTFPVLYGVETNESVMDYGIDFRSVYEIGRITLEVGNFGREHDNISVSLAAAEAMEIAGAFHKNILLEIFRRCPRILDENRLLLQIPDAFPLAFLARTGKIGIDVDN